MVNFKELYKHTKVYPAETLYNTKKVVIADKFAISNKEVIVLNIESTKSQYLQGICLGITGRCRIEGQTFKKGKFMNFFLWQESSWYNLNNKQELQIFTKEPFIYIANAWRRVENGEDGPVCWAGGDQWMMHDEMGGAGLIVEEIENEKRYYCNDGDCDDDFDDIIFTVTRKKE